MHIHDWKIYYERKYNTRYECDCYKHIRKRLLGHGLLTLDEIDEIEQKCNEQDYTLKTDK